MKDDYPLMRNGRRHPLDCVRSIGYQDARAGIELEDCPYDDERKPSGKLSWSRAHIRAWQDGWRRYHQENT